MLYDIRLKITHRYEAPAGNSRHLLRVLPGTIPGRQRVLAVLLDVSPKPDERGDSLDFFGNMVATVSHLEPHDEMAISMSCRVEVLPVQSLLDVSAERVDLLRQVSELRDLTPGSPVHFLGPSQRLMPSSEISDFAKNAVRAGESSAAAVKSIGEALHERMTFDAEATTVRTDPRDAFLLGRGVCQDYTHIMILALRSLGIPAGYVSGFIRTVPPPGQERLEGADAMHAWVRAWCGMEQGWIEYDPTNATFVGQDHIVLGHGRDYADISPVVGHLRSSGGSQNQQAVDVIPVE
ncbi:transglutaminase family protein [Primorskyibacter sp. 2E107]|uniref:transglutaminase family protein n=1 Tax=Primorskyibacter sp. 2E107 TaxID=3403458 RepID=UPI003AF4E87A